MEMVKKSLLLTGILSLLLPLHSNAQIITFNELVHGKIVDDDYLLTHGLSISANNIGGGPDIAAIFDSTKTGTRDSDLEDPWAKGNLAPGTSLGNLLIIAENAHDPEEDGILNLPDDEGSRPAGSLIFDFLRPISEFGFDLVDVEGPAEIGQDSGYVATFFANNTELARVGFGDLIDSSSPFYDPSIVFGNNSANRIMPIEAANLGIGAFNRVEINFGGSAAIDNITWEEFEVPPPNTEVPLPASWLLWLLGLGIGYWILNRKKMNVA